MYKCSTLPEAVLIQATFKNLTYGNGLENIYIFFCIFKILFEVLSEIF